MKQLRVYQYILFTFRWGGEEKLFLFLIFGFNFPLVSVISCISHTLTDTEMGGVGFMCFNCPAFF